MAGMQPHGEEGSFRENIKSQKYQKKSTVDQYLKNRLRRRKKEKLHLSELGL